MWILLLVGMPTCTVTVKNSMEVYQKKKKLKEELPYDSAGNSTPGYISKKTKSTNLKRYMHPSVHVCA